MSSPLQGYVALRPPQPEMPLLHSTDILAARSIATAPAHTLSPTHCGVFKEPLLYLFYGRPAYRVAPNEGARRDSFYCPVCFILEPETARAAKRIFPFDTGAFDSGLFDCFKHKKMKLEDFFLGDRMEMAQRHVTAFFESNRSYYFGQARNPLSFEATELEAQAYHNLIATTRKEEFDDRCCSVEFQLDGDVSLTGRTLAVVLPKAFAAAPEIMDFLKRIGATPLTYNTYHGFTPASYHGIVNEKITDFFEGRGLV